MKILFIHQNFPGQFRRIATTLASDPAYDILAIGKAGCPKLAGVRTVTYALHRVSAPQTHAYAKPFETGILHGQAVLRVLLSLRAQGYKPDVIVAHGGWGEALFTKDAFPNVPLLHFAEFYYRTTGADVGFDPEFPMPLNDRARVRAKNGVQLLNLEQCDAAVTPTRWQHSIHPAEFHSKIRIVHEGVDTDTMRPNPDASFTLAGGKIWRAGDPIVTYVARNLEPYRGFHTFMRALPQILVSHPTCEIAIVGGDGVSYGSKPAQAPDWRTQMLREVSLDTSRVHFLGQIPYARYRKLLQVSAAHVYLTYPFVLSWSLLEAMACGCLVIGSDTGPVRDVVRDGENGILVPFFDATRIAGAVTGALGNPHAMAGLRARAVKTVRENFSAEAGTAAYIRLLSDLRASSLDEINTI